MKTIEDFKHELAAAYVNNATDKDKKLIMKHYGKGSKSFDDFRSLLSKRASLKKTARLPRMPATESNIALLRDILAKPALLGAGIGTAAGAIGGAASEDSTALRGAGRGALIGGGIGTGIGLGALTGGVTGGAAGALFKPKNFKMNRNAIDLRNLRGSAPVVEGALMGIPVGATLGGIAGGTLGSRVANSLQKESSAMNKKAYEIGVKEALTRLGLLDKTAAGNSRLGSVLVSGGLGGLMGAGLGGLSADEGNVGSGMALGGGLGALVGGAGGALFHNPGTAARAVRGASRAPKAVPSANAARAARVAKSGLTQAELEAAAVAGGGAPGATLRPISGISPAERKTLMAHMKKSNARFSKEHEAMADQLLKDMEPALQKMQAEGMHPRDLTRHVVLNMAKHPELGREMERQLASAGYSSGSPEALAELLASAVPKNAKI